jgi:hypothetical protein
VTIPGTFPTKGCIDATDAASANFATCLRSSPHESARETHNEFSRNFSPLRVIYIFLPLTAYQAIYNYWTHFIFPYVFVHSVTFALLSYILRHFSEISLYLLQISFSFIISSFRFHTHKMSIAPPILTPYLFLTTFPAFASYNHWHRLMFLIFLALALIL